MIIEAAHLAKVERFGAQAKHLWSKCRCPTSARCWQMWVLS